MGAAIAGGIAWANLTRPAQEEVVVDEPRSETVSEERHGEGSDDVKPIDGENVSGPAAATEGGDGGETKGEPASEPEASVPAVPDLSDPDDRYALNKFMSNFSESLIYRGIGSHGDFKSMREAGAHFDRDAPDYGITAWFLFANSWQNGGTLIDGGAENDNALFMPWASVDYMTNLFFDRKYDWGDYLREERYGAANGKEDVGLAFQITNGVPTGGPTVVESVEALGDGRIRIGYDAYTADSSGSAYANMGNLGTSQLYGMDVSEVNSYLGTDGPKAHGTAVLEARRDGDGWRFALVSYDLDEPAPM